MSPMSSPEKSLPYGAGYLARAVPLAASMKRKRDCRDIALMSEGAKFRCTGIFTKNVLKQLSRRSHVNVQESNQRPTLFNMCWHMGAGSLHR